MAKHLSEYKTEWFIQLAEELGHPVSKRVEAPNGGEVIYFEGFSKDVGNGKRNPYFMVWTGNEDAGPEDWNQWHAEFGHWYFPKNNKERNEFPPTAQYSDRDIPTQMRLYSERAKKESEQ